MGSENNISEVDQSSFSSDNEPDSKAQHKLATTLPLFALNHISFLVKNLDDSAHFYQKVLGFVIIKRPDVFDFEGIWMFGHGVAVHLLGLGQKPGDNKCGNKRKIIRIDNHVSFQCSNLYSMMRVLETSGQNFRKCQIKLGGKIVVDRIIFHDPDGNMIEITNSQKLPIVPLSYWPPQSMPTPNLEFFTPAGAKELTGRLDHNKCTCDNEQVEGVFLDNTANEPHLLAMNHVGHLCESLEESIKFYKEVLEFVSIEMPDDETLKSCNRAWLFGHGIGIHLLESKKKHGACPIVGREIDPQDNHISFQCTNMYNIIRRLDEKGINYKPMDIKEDGIIVNQIFIHDPDGNMIEFCNCQNLPVVPIPACPPKKMPTPNLDLTTNKELACKPGWPPCKRKQDEEYYHLSHKSPSKKFRCAEITQEDCNCSQKDLLE